MTKKYLHFKKIEIPLYRGNLLLIFTNSKKKLKKYLIEWDDTAYIYGHSWLINYEKKEGYTIVLNFDNETLKITHGMITHEAIHITNFIADYRGFKADFNNDEPLAYLADWVTEQVYEFINELDFSKKMKQYKKQ